MLYSLSRFVFENNQFDPGYDDIDYDNSYIEGNDLYLKLTTVSADLLYNLSNDRWASVVNEEYVKANPDALVERPCGTGPYVCDENVEAPIPPIPAGMTTGASCPTPMWTTS